MVVGCSGGESRGVVGCYGARAAAEIEDGGGFVRRVVVAVVVVGNNGSCGGSGGRGVEIDGGRRGNLFGVWRRSGYGNRNSHS